VPFGGLCTGHPSKTSRPSRPSVQHSGHPSNPGDPRSKKSKTFPGLRSLARRRRPFQHFDPATPANLRPFQCFQWRPSKSRAIPTFHYRIFAVNRKSAAPHVVPPSGGPGPCSAQKSPMFHLFQITSPTSSTGRPSRQDDSEEHPARTPRTPQRHPPSEAECLLHSNNLAGLYCDTVMLAGKPASASHPNTSTGTSFALLHAG
jgi:hypothetical protein